MDANKASKATKVGCSQLLYNILLDVVEPMTGISIRTRLHVHLCTLEPSNA